MISSAFSTTEGLTPDDWAKAAAFSAWNPTWRVEETRDDEGTAFLSVIPPGKQCAWWICRTTTHWVTILSPCGTEVIWSTDVAAALAGVWEHAT